MPGISTHVFDSSGTVVPPLCCPSAMTLAGRGCRKQSKLVERELTVTKTTRLVDTLNHLSTKACIRLHLSSRLGGGF
jgi:hypothetical protein